MLHFVGDWLLQTTWMAMNKTRSWRALLWHVVVYTAAFAVVLPLWRFASTERIAIVLGWVFLSHLAIDTYRPLYFWQLYVHRNPWCQTWEGFLRSYDDHRGFLVNVTLDQVMHLLCPLPVAALKQPVVPGW